MSIRSSYVMLLSPSLGLMLTAPWAQRVAGSGTKRDIVLATTPMGSPGYTLSVGQGNLLKKKLPAYNVTVQPATGAQSLPRLLVAGEAHLVTIASVTMYWAFRGEEDFTTPLSSLRVLQSGNDILFAFITRKETGIQSIEDLRGKRITCLIPGATLISRLATLQLQAYGLDPKKDVTLLKAEFTNVALTNLMEKRTDAIMAALTGGKMYQAEAKTPLRVLPFQQSKVPFLQKSLPIFFPVKTPEGLPGVTPGIPVVSNVNILIGTKDLDDTTAYTLVKTLVENYAELIPIHKDFAGLGPERAVSDQGMPYHPGAVKYFKEKKLWTSEMETRQAQLLSGGK